MSGERYDKLIDEVLQSSTTTKFIIIYGYHHWLKGQYILRKPLLYNLFNILFKLFVWKLTYSDIFYTRNIYLTDYLS